MCARYFSSCITPFSVLVFANFTFNVTGAICFRSSHSWSHATHSRHAGEEQKTPRSFVLQARRVVCTHRTMSQALSWRLPGQVHLETWDFLLLLFATSLIPSGRARVFFFFGCPVITSAGESELQGPHPECKRSSDLARGSLGRPHNQSGCTACCPDRLLLLQSLPLASSRPL